MSLIETFLMKAGTLEPKRGFGKILFHIQETRSHEDARQRLDQFCSSLGLNVLGMGWEEVSRDFAIEHLADLLQQGMAYNVKIMDAQEAQDLAVGLVSLFDASTLWFSNVSEAGASLKSGWNPLTSATFDSGIALVTPDHVAIIWFEDED